MVRLESDFMMETVQVHLHSANCKHYIPNNNNASFTGSQSLLVLQQNLLPQQRHACLQADDVTIMTGKTQKCALESFLISQRML